MKNAFVYLFTFIVAFTLTLSCSGDDDGGGNNTPKSDAKAITSFKFEVNQNDGLSENINATINENDKTITAAMPYGTDITSLVPAIEVSPKATFSSEGKQDFSTGVIYTVTAEDGTKAQYTVTVTIAPNTEAKIISFAFLAENNAALEEDTTAIIDEEAKTVTAYVAYGTDITELIPTLEVSPQATYSPEGARDFSSEVVYTITAGDENTQVDYTVNVSEASNSDAKILSFTFLAENNAALEEDVTAVIDEEAKTVTAEVPYGTDITTLLPSVDVSPDASFSPEGTQDFSSGVVYTVTAQDNSTTDYTVTVHIGMEPQRAALIAIYNANPGNTLEWDLEDPDLNNWEGVSADESGNVTGLFLSSKELASIPAEIGQFYSLNHLYLSENQLTSIPAEIGQLANLTHLRLSENQLIMIPSEIGQLTNLNELLLNNNQLTTIPSEIGQLANLTILDLSYNQLATMPVEIGQLSNLNELGLSSNQLTSVPTNIIGQLPNLERLNLDDNQLTTIPSEIGQLNNLTYLNLSNNQLASIPTESGQLSNLRGLYLSGNQLTSAPTEIGQLADLTLLDLNYNQLTSVPAEIGQLSNLRRLYLSGNQLTAVPAEIGQLNNLSWLLLESNQLTSIPVEIGQLNNLNILYLDGNPLTFIPQEVCDMKENYGTVFSGVSALCE